MQQEVAPGHPAPSSSRTTATGGPYGAAEPVERVDSPGHDQPLDHRAADLGTMPKVGEGEVRLAGHHALNLAVTDALDVGQGQPDAVRPPVGKVGDRLFPDRLLSRAERVDHVALKACLRPWTDPF